MGSCACIGKGDASSFVHRCSKIISLDVIGKRNYLNIFAFLELSLIYKTINKYIRVELCMALI